MKASREGPAARAPRAADTVRVAATAAVRVAVAAAATVTVVAVATVPATAADATPPRAAGARRVTRAGILALTAAFAAAAPGGSPAAQPPATVEVRASRRGFEPSSLSLRRGETAHLVLTSADGEHCFAIDELRIEKRIVPGRPTRFDLTPERAGAFSFYCCLESGEAAQTERGQLSVGE